MKSANVSNRESTPRITKLFGIAIACVVVVQFSAWVAGAWDYPVEQDYFTLMAMSRVRTVCQDYYQETGQYPSSMKSVRKLIEADLPSGDSGYMNEPLSQLQYISDGNGYVLIARYEIRQKKLFPFPVDRTRKAVRIATQDGGGIRYVTE